MIKIGSGKAIRFIEEHKLEDNLVIAPYTKDDLYESVRGGLNVCVADKGGEIPLVVTLGWISNKEVSAHMYVNPSYKTKVVPFIQQMISELNAKGITTISTYANQIVKNFLCKRLGFVVVSEFTHNNNKYFELKLKN